MENSREETKIKVYFDEEYDGLTHKLRLNKREPTLLDKSIGFEEKGFFIPKKKFDWIKKAEDEYQKAQRYIYMKLIENDLI